MYCCVLILNLYLIYINFLWCFFINCKICTRAFNQHPHQSLPNRSASYLCKICTIIIYIFHTSPCYEKKNFLSKSPSTKLRLPSSCCVGSCVIKYAYLIVSRQVHTWLEYIWPNTPWIGHRYLTDYASNLFLTETPVNSHRYMTEYTSTWSLLFSRIHPITSHHY